MSQRESGYARKAGDLYETPEWVRPSCNCLRHRMSDDELRIVAVSLSLKRVVLSDGQVLPMTDFFRGAKDCEPDEATSAVAGPAKDGTWFAVDLKLFGPSRLH